MPEHELGQLEGYGEEGKRTGFCREGQRYRGRLRGLERTSQDCWKWW